MKKRLNSRERTLLLLIGGIAFLLANLALFTSFRKQKAQADANLATRQAERAALEELIAADPLGAERELWATARQPKLENPAQAGVALLESVRQAAKAHNVLLESPELGRTTPQAAYRAVTVQVQTKSGWPELVAFMNALQQPEEFIVFENATLRIDSADPTRMHGTFRIARWYAP